MTSIARTLRNTIANSALVALFAMGAVMLVPAALGYERYVLVSGSMSGTYDTGSVVFAKERPVDTLRVGDVITYAPPAGSTPMELVTHRIASIGRNAFGTKVFRTKGDANQAIDPWRFTLDAPTQAVVSFHVPHVGHAISALSDRNTRMLIIGLPALLVAIAAVGGLFRDARRERLAPRRVTA